MTERELEEFISNHHTLYHMTECGSSVAIMEQGLLSTAALLNMYKVPPEKRKKIKERRRESIPITHGNLPLAVIRDQIPLSDTKLATCLPDGWKPAYWRRILNQKCFFWVEEDRLTTLQGAKAYRGKSYDVLEVDARSLIDAYRDKIHLCHINSGSTSPYASPRGGYTFAKIEDYPHPKLPRKTPPPRTTAAELTIDWAVPDIRKHIKYIKRFHGTECVKSTLINPHLCSQDS